LEVLLDNDSKKIVEYYPDKEIFVREAIRIFDRLMTYIIDVNGFHSQEQITSNWINLIKACERAIDSMIENTAEQGYCAWLEPKDSQL